MGIRLTWQIINIDNINTKSWFHDALNLFTVSSRQ